MVLAQLVRQVIQQPRYYHLLWSTLLLLAAVAAVAELETAELAAVEQVAIEQLVDLLWLWVPQLQLL
jgi:hypothetical protein